jgi:pyruvate/2-oxoglutarate dehydrogenase complex dihydrolipoamide acyltransferase (E2) component
MRSGQHVNVTHNIAQFHEDEAYVEDEISDEGENLLGSNHVSVTPTANPSQGNHINVTTPTQPSRKTTNASPIVQPSQGNTIRATPAILPLHTELVILSSILLIF